jgi:superfamily I DNA and/or RNA helicase
MFYDGELIRSANRANTDIFLGWKELPNPQYPAVFHAINGENLQEKDSPSWFNPQEVAEVLMWVKKIDQFIKTNKLERRLGMQDIGIISPYHKQVKKIRQALESPKFGISMGLFISVRFCCFLDSNGDTFRT